MQTIVETEEQPIDKLEELKTIDKGLEQDVKQCMDHSFKNIMLNYSKKNVCVPISLSFVLLQESYTLKLSSAHPTHPIFLL